MSQNYKNATHSGHSIVKEVSSKENVYIVV